MRLRDLLQAAGARPGSQVRVESLEAGGLYRTSHLNSSHAWSPSTVLATAVNGQRLDLDHGYPLRLLAPNRPGVLQTKWLKRGGGAVTDVPVTDVRCRLSGDAPVDVPPWRGRGLLYALGAALLAFGLRGIARDVNGWTHPTYWAPLLVLFALAHDLRAGPAGLRRRRAARPLRARPGAPLPRRRLGAVRRRPRRRLARPARLRAAARQPERAAAGLRRWGCAASCWSCGLPCSLGSSCMPSATSCGRARNTRAPTGTHTGHDPRRRHGSPRRPPGRPARPAHR